MTQEAFEEWWPRIIQFFGPVDSKSTHHGFATEVGLKQMSNDQLRNAFLNAYVPKAEKYGLELPEYPRIRKRDDGTYEVEEDDLDWDEFFTVSKNQYEPGKGQIDARAAAQDAVEWVRETLDDVERRTFGAQPQAAD
jgi:ring-1,2-phenylacetyl-CoA epoxidase subunit PaaA